MPFPRLPAQSNVSDKDGRMSFVWNNWFERLQTVSNLITGAGVTAGRPTQDLFPGCPYFDTTENQLYVWTGSAWIAVGVISGSTSERPANPYVGQLYFDTAQNQLFSWNGSIWVATGVTAGTTASRPATDLYTGRLYYDTTLGQLIVWTGSAWRYTSSGYYGVFYDTTTQTAGSTTTAYAVTFNSTDGHWDVSVASSSQITFAHAGTYNLQFSLQLESSESNASLQGVVSVWFRKNGTDIVDSNSMFSVPNRHGSTDGKLIAALNFITDVAANDYVQLMWHTTNTNVLIRSTGTQSSPTRPATPGAIFTATQV